MTEMELYMVQALVVCVFIFIMFTWAWKLKVRYQKESIDHILGEFVTPVGTGYPLLLRVEGGLVQIEPDDKKGIKGKAFPVSEQASFLVDYPEGPWCPRFLKCKIKKIVFREWDVEPVSNLYSNEPVYKPELLFSLRNERMSELGLIHARDEAKREGLPTKALKFGDVKMWLILLGVAIIGVAVYMFFQMETLSHALGV